MGSLNRGQRVLGTLQTLAEFGEVTAVELAEYTGVSRYDAHAVLNRMNKRTRAGVKRIHIVRWVHDQEGSRKYPRAVYALGDAPDAKRPKADQLRVKREYYQRTKGHATMNSVFNLGLKWRAGA